MTYESPITPLPLKIIFPVVESEIPELPTIIPIKQIIPEQTNPVNAIDILYYPYTTLTPQKKQVR